MAGRQSRRPLRGELQRCAKLLAQAPLAGTPLTRDAVASFAGAAMGCQAALNKTGVFARQPTTVTTSNFMQWVALFFLPVEPDQSVSERRETHLRLTCCLAAFCAGAALGAFGQHAMGFWSLAAPLAVLLALAHHVRRVDRGGDRAGRAVPH